jgi:hypothetical protein
LQDAIRPLLAKVVLRRKWLLSNRKQSPQPALQAEIKQLQVQNFHVVHLDMTLFSQIGYSVCSRCRASKCAGRGWRKRNCPDLIFPHFLDGSSIFQIQNCFAGGFRIAEDGMRRA